MRQTRFLAPFLTLTLGCALYACSGDDASSGTPDDTDSGTSPSSDAGKKDASVPPATDGSVADANAVDSTAPPVKDSGAADASHADAGDASSSVTDAGDASVGDASASDASATDTDAGDGSTADAGPVVARKVWVLRVGDGAEGGTLSKTSTAAVLEEYAATAGASAPLRTIALPTAAAGASAPITFAGSSSVEGALSLSGDGHYVTMAGYAAVPGVTAVDKTPSSSVDAAAFTNRVVARVDANGAVDTSTLLAGAFDGSSIRGATTADGAHFWVSGSVPSGQASVHYVALGSTGATTPIVSTPTVLRAIDVYGDQLFVSSKSNTWYGISSVGVGLPTSAAGATLVVGSATTPYSPNGFVALDTDTTPGVDRMYIGDDTTAAADAGFAGGVQKWTLSGGTWSLTATFANGLPSGARGVAAFVDGTAVTLVATTPDNKLVVGVDDGTTAPTFTTITEIAPGTAAAFRGLVPAPH